VKIHVKLDPYFAGHRSQVSLSLKELFITKRKQLTSNTLQIEMILYII